MIKFTSHCSLYCYLSSFLIFALGEHGLSLFFMFFFFRWEVNSPNSTVGHLSIFFAQVGIFVPLILLRTLVHFYLSSHSFSFCPFLPLVSLFFFFFEVPGTCPFLFPRIFLHNPCLFCIESFWRERITTIGTVSDNIFSNFNEW